jgi:hypothetical protein
MAWLLGPVCAQQSFSVQRWVVTGVSSEQWESHPAIDPTNGDLWFVRSDKHFSGWRLYWARCEGNQRDTGEKASGELFIASLDASSQWPPNCSHMRQH